MITINYNVTLTNPAKEILLVTDDLTTKSTLDVKEIGAGFLITGSIDKEGKSLKAANLSLGSEWSLNEESWLEKNSKQLLDIEEVFKIHGKAYNEVENTTLTHIKTLSRTGTEGLFQMKDIVANREAVVIVGLTPQGIFEIVEDVQIEAPTTFLTVPLSESFTSLFYFLISNPLSASDEHPLFIPTEDLHKLPTGFCALSNKAVLADETRVTNTADGLLIYTKNKSELTFSQSVLLDGVPRDRYTTSRSEYTHIESAHNWLNLADLTLNPSLPNATIIYELQPTGVLKPHSCLVDDALFQLHSLRESSLNIENVSTVDSEFKKKYVYQQLRTYVYINNAQYILENRDVLETLKTSFSNKIIKL